MKFFFCVGAQKAGTTFLHNVLSSHPEVALPPIKELHFFDELMAMERRPAWKRLYLGKYLTQRRRLAIEYVDSVPEYGTKEKEWIADYVDLKRRKKNISQYRGLLEKLVETERLVGEITPDYSILTADVVKEMADCFPEAHIIFIMRDPVARDISQAKMNWWRHKTEAQSNSEETSKMITNWATAQDRINPRSDYLRTINTYQNFFPADQLHFFFYDELREGNLAFVNKILSTLEIAPISSLPATNPNKGMSLNIPLSVEQHLYQLYSSSIDELAAYFSEAETNYPLLWKNRKDEYLGLSDTSN